MLQILDTISDPGNPGKPNEDAFGHGARHAWVIDGATGVADSELLDDLTDAHWLAREAGAFFAARAHDHGEDLHGLTRSAIEALSRRFEAERKREPNGRYELPSAAMSLVHVGEHEIVCANFADCHLVLLADDGEVTALGDAFGDHSEEGRKRTAAMLDKIADGESPFASDDVMRYLRAARNRQNTDDGYWIFGVDPRAVDYMRHWSLPLTKPVTGLLMTDGFASLAVDYKRLQPAELVARARDEGLAALLGEIRKIEREEDPNMRRYPRFKRSDDATAVLFRAAPR
ncbi:MAG: protein phosphatase 2C domain-containing protein [Parvibaculum sp.]|uniref:protein phosphatase 2C domain-containing protein n=1 Tax=Parvibaculum sp. TaxID=2024848 RepID=UPI0028417ADD|nr:protein phosphatase 2C domain-containing protein [Parvibaculum sp.]MDR3500096.1 protein phosphatase 2C domain-containing protein [Parvibaculum sp.]